MVSVREFPRLNPRTAAGTYLSWSGGSDMVLELLPGVALRAAIIYGYLLLVVRIMGKRTVGDVSAFDPIVALIIRELGGPAILGEAPMEISLLGIAVFSGLHFLNGYLSWKSPALDRLTGGKPRVLVERGKIDRRALAREHLNEDDLRALMRQQGVEDLADVERAVMEQSGTLSVIKTQEAQEAKRRDIRDLDVDR
jgi:uncharacterized membrane protein YcaP (DUF421 family)